MPPYPRSHYVTEGEIGTYHTFSRCVQRAFLCGYDSYSGVNYDHRREWIEKLFQYQAGVFAIDLGNYDILSNHEHLLVRTRPDISLQWSDEEVAWRWKMAWPKWNGKSWECNPPDEAIRRLLYEADRLAAARKNLASLSWFMARVKEPIAKLANAESGTSGHFWEQRFGCRRLEDPPAVLTCSIYMDVNQLAAGMALSLEASNHSAVQRRLVKWRREQALLSLEKLRTPDRPDVKMEVKEMERLFDCSFLSPISERGPLILLGDLSPKRKIILPSGYVNSSNDSREAELASNPPELDPTVEPGEIPSTPDAEIAVTTTDDELPSDNTAEPESAERRSAARRSRLSRDDRSAAPPTYHIHRRQKSLQRARASDNPILDVTPDQYQQLVMWTAARIVGKELATEEMPEEVTGFLQQVGISTKNWLQSVTGFHDKFRFAVGAENSLQVFLNRKNRKTIHGIRACRTAFT